MALDLLDESIHQNVVHVLSRHAQGEGSAIKEILVDTQAAKRNVSGAGRSPSVRRLMNGSKITAQELALDSLARSVRMKSDEAQPISNRVRPMKRGWALPFLACVRCPCPVTIARTISWLATSSTAGIYVDDNYGT